MNVNVYKKNQNIFTNLHQFETFVYNVSKKYLNESEPSQNHTHKRIRQMLLRSVFLSSILSVKPTKNIVFQKMSCLDFKGIALISFIMPKMFVDIIIIFCEIDSKKM